MARSWLRLQFTFTHPDDVDAYGAGPHLYDEHVIAGMSARDLADLEDQIGEPVVSVLNGLRDSRPLSDLLATWWALHQAGLSVDLDKYNPHTMMIEWEPAPAEPGKGDDYPGPRPILDAVPTVSLPTLPSTD